MPHRKGERVLVRMVVRDLVKIEQHWKPQQITWNAEMRSVLCILRRLYANSWTDLSCLWYSIFEEVLIQQGLPQDISSKTTRIKTQFYDICRKPTCYADLILGVPFRQLPSTCAGVVHLIELAAYRNGIDLQPRPREDPELENLFLSIAATGLPYSNTTYDTSSDTASEGRDEEVGQDSPLVRKHTTVSQVSTADHLTSRVIPPYEIYQARDLPILEGAAPLLFRVFDSTSQGLNSEGGLQAAAYTRRSYDRQSKGTSTYTYSNPDGNLTAEIANHLNRKIIPEGSHYVSLTTSLIWAMHMGMKFSANPSRVGPVKIAIIDGIACDRLHTLHNVSGLVEQMVNSNDPAVRANFASPGQRRRYRGCFEVLAFQRVSRECIILIFTLEELFQYATNHSSIQKLLSLDSIRDLNGSLNTGVLRRNIMRRKIDEHTVAQGLADFIAFIQKENQTFNSFAKLLSRYVIQNWAVLTRLDCVEDLLKKESFLAQVQECLRRKAIARSLLPSRPCTPKINCENEAITPPTAYSTGIQMWLNMTPKGNSQSSWLYSPFEN